MTVNPVLYKSLRTMQTLTVLWFLVITVTAYSLALYSTPITEFDWFLITPIFLGIPVLSTLLGFYLGWRMKKTTIDYKSPDWSFEPVQMRIQDFKDLIREHNRSYSRLVVISNFWMFYIPVLLVIILFALPFSAFYINIEIFPFVPGLFALGIATTFSLASFGSYRATSNDASEDFTIPFTHEAVELASVQILVTGISNVRIVLDKGNYNDLKIYQNPRVVLRILGIEKDGYIESWSYDFGAVNRVLCRLTESDKNEQIIWWWTATDRNFMKYIGNSKDGYYVRNPVLSETQKLGVKDIELVTKNAVAIIAMEWLRAHEDGEQLRKILREIGISSPQNQNG